MDQPFDGRLGGNMLEGFDDAALHPDGRTAMVLRDGKLSLAPLNGGPRKEFWQPESATSWSFSSSPAGSRLVGQS
jgi:hypothetical protein